MFLLVKADLGPALINATRSERSALGVPAGFDALPWDRLDFHGWRDPRYPRRGYVVRPEADGRLTAVLLQAAESRMVPGRKAMCSICRAVDASDSVVLFAARRAGTAGRRGDTVATYMCTGLDCSLQFRDPPQRAGRSRLGEKDADPDVVAAGMLERLDGFLAAVTRD